MLYPWWYFFSGNPLVELVKKLDTKVDQIICDPELLEKTHSLILAVREEKTRTQRSLKDELDSHKLLKYRVILQSEFIPGVGCCIRWVVALKGDPNTRLMVNGRLHEWRD